MSSKVTIKGVMKMLDEGSISIIDGNINKINTPNIFSTTTPTLKSNLLNY